MAFHGAGAQILLQAAIAIAQRERGLTMRPRFLWIPLVAALVAGCATMKAGSHIERGAELTHYRTWEWAPAEERPTGDPRLDNNPMFELQLRSAVEHQLAGKGYVRTPLAGPPDLRARYHVNFSRTVEIAGGAASPGSCSRDCEPDAYAYQLGTLAVDLVDARTNKVVWSGWSRDNMEGVIDNQDRMEREIDRVVAAMFERIPSAR